MRALARNWVVPRINTFVPVRLMTGILCYSMIPIWFIRLVKMYNLNINMDGGIMLAY